MTQETLLAEVEATPVAEEQAAVVADETTPAPETTEQPEATEGAEPAPAPEPEVELAPLDLERFPDLAKMEVALPLEQRTQLRELIADQMAAVHNGYSDFNDQISQRADAVIAQVGAAQTTVRQLATVVQQGIANGTINAQQLASMLDEPTKDALKALAPHVVAAEVDKVLKEERPQIQAESFNQGVVFALYEPVRGLKIPNLTKQVTDLLRETKGEEKQNVPSQIIGAVHEAGIKEGIRRGEAAFGRAKSVDNNNGAGQASLAGNTGAGARKKYVDMSFEERQSLTPEQRDRYIDEDRNRR